MVHFPANLLYKTTIQLVCKSLFIPWVNRSRINGRNYTSSLPLHKLSQGEESVASSLRKKISDDGKLENHKPEVEVEVAELSNGREQEAVGSFNPCAGSGEGDISIRFWAEDNYMKEPHELANKHQCNLMDLSHGKYQTQACGNKPDAERLAIQLLSTRAFTASELMKKLLGKNFPLETVNTVVADFQNRGYINDCYYAETFSRSRFSSSCWGPKRIKQTLFKKGVRKLDAEEAVKLVFEEDESVKEPELVVGMSKVSMDHLLVQATKQWLRNQKVSSEKRKSRLVQWLQYRGFDWSVISFVIKKLESGYVP